MFVLVIPQYEYNILVITQVRGEAKKAGDNKDIVRVYWGITILYPTHQSPVELLSDGQTILYSYKFVRLCFVQLVDKQAPAS